MRSCAPIFLAYLNAGFLLLALDAIELRIGGAKQILPGIDPIANPRVTDRHLQQIRHLGAGEFLVNRCAQACDLLLRCRFLEHHELITAITCDKTARRRANVLERGRDNLKGMVAFHMSIMVVNLLKAIGIHHQQIHIVSLISI